MFIMIAYMFVMGQPVGMIIDDNSVYNTEVACIMSTREHLANLKAKALPTGQVTISEEGYIILADDSGNGVVADCVTPEEYEKIVAEKEDA